MSHVIVLNIICFQTEKKLTTLNKTGVLLKGVLIDLRARENLFECMLRARSSPCKQFIEPFQLFSCPRPNMGHGQRKNLPKLIIIIPFF